MQGPGRKFLLLDNSSVPVDHYSKIYVAFILSGIGYMLPYTCFIVAVDYYQVREITFVAVLSNCLKFTVLSIHIYNTCHIAIITFISAASYNTTWPGCFPHDQDVHTMTRFTPPQGQDVPHKAKMSPTWPRCLPHGQDVSHMTKMSPQGQDVPHMARMFTHGQEVLHMTRLSPTWPGCP